jgi:hypothetical protein
MLRRPLSERWRTFFGSDYALLLSILTVLYVAIQLSRGHTISYHALVAVTLLLVLLAGAWALERHGKISRADSMQPVSMVALIAVAWLTIDSSIDGPEAIENRDKLLILLALVGVVFVAMLLVRMLSLLPSAESFSTRQGGARESLHKPLDLATRFEPLNHFVGQVQVVGGQLWLLTDVNHGVRFSTEGAKIALPFFGQDVIVTCDIEKLRAEPADAPPRVSRSTYPVHAEAYRDGEYTFLTGFLGRTPFVAQVSEGLKVSRRVADYSVILVAHECTIQQATGSPGLETARIDNVPGEGQDGASSVSHLPLNVSRHYNRSEPDK